MVQCCITAPAVRPNASPMLDHDKMPALYSSFKRSSSSEVHWRRFVRFRLGLSGLSISNSLLHSGLLPPLHQPSPSSSLLSFVDTSMLSSAPTAVNMLLGPWSGPSLPSRSEISRPISSKPFQIDCACRFCRGMDSVIPHVRQLGVSVSEFDGALETGGNRQPDCIVGWIRLSALGSVISWARTKIP